MAFSCSAHAFAGRPNPNDEGDVYCIMVSFASRARTSLSIAGALGTIIAALLLSPRSEPDLTRPGDFADDGWRLDARLASTKILPGTLEHDLAITIQAPPEGVRRPPTALAIVIDRSGSMTDSAQATPMSDAKAAAARIVEALEPDDAFSVVAYSSQDEAVHVIHAMSRADATNKEAARTAIAKVQPGTGTCISCGITQGVIELDRSPLRGGMKRMILISDGQATEGLRDRDDLVELAAQTAAKGISISGVGVGLEFDELTMQRIASVGRGNYHFVEDTKELGAMFDRELLGLSETIAHDMQLAIFDSAGTEVVEVYGYPHSTRQGKTIIPIADMRSGESRKVVVRVKVVPTELGELVLPSARLRWRHVGNDVERAAQKTPVVEVVEDPAAVASAIDPETVILIEEALTSRALAEASEVIDTHGSDAALQVLERRAAAIRANAALPDPSAKALSATNEAAAEALRSELPGRAKKVARIHSYQLAR